MENSIYYKITGSLTSDFGETITNPVIKVAQVATDSQLLADGLLRFEYKVYSSEDNLLAGYFFFKAWDSEENKRIVNFTYLSFFFSFAIFASKPRNRIFSQPATKSEAIINT